MIPEGSGEPRGGAPVIRVLLVDDDQLMRAGLRLIVQQAPDLTVVGEAADGREAVDAARRDRPQVVVMDVRMPVPGRPASWSR